MKKILNKDWFKIVLGIILIFSIIISILKISRTSLISESNSNTLGWWILLITAAIGIYIIVFYYLKNIGNRKNSNKELDFLKTLLPATVSIITLYGY